MGLALLLGLAAGCAAPPPPAVVGGAPPPERSASDAAAPRPAPTAPSAAPPAEGHAEEVKKPDAAGPDQPAKAPGAAVVVPGALGGNISQADIQKIVVKHGELFDACYKLGAGATNKFVATVTVKATVGPTGKVNAAEVVKSTSKSKQVDACVAEAFKKMQFPPPEGGVTSVISFPIEFNGVEEVIN